MITNPYDAQFEEYLVFELGYNLDTISLHECLQELKEFNKKNKYNV